MSDLMYRIIGMILGNIIYLGITVELDNKFFSRRFKKLYKYLFPWPVI